MVGETQGKDSLPPTGFTIRQLTKTFTFSFHIFPFDTGIENEKLIDQQKFS
jgi:hypothetical protein